MKILLLGSTGSIGISAVRCITRFPDRFTLVGLAANTSTDALIAQARHHAPTAVCLGSAKAAAKAREQLGPTVQVFHGAEGLEQIVNETDFDLLLNALVGAVGFRPTVAALKRNKRVALANKESLVIGGEVITDLLQQGHGSLLPIDSEHSAILQCLGGEDHLSIESIILTASGGPFNLLPREKFASITPADALKHPTWSMGAKITIDSATLMNKGFEVIEAHHLFAMPYNQLKIVIHPQSIIHSMVVYNDGAVIAQCGVPDMELPIQYALSYPERLPLPGKRLNLAQIGSLTFSEPDMDRFPCLKLCLDAGQSGGTLPTVLNAANETAVRLFLDGVIGYTQISVIVKKCLDRHENCHTPDVDLIGEIDARTREFINSHLFTMELS
jgi:1-deoxy-D-xylulose-5-phosphate reductoisomerase